MFYDIYLFSLSVITLIVEGMWSTNHKHVGMDENSGITVFYPIYNPILIWFDEIRYGRTYGKCSK